MIKACLFDLDGTILDTIKTIAYYGNTSLEKFGIKTIDVERYKYLAGNGSKNLVERMLRDRDCYSKELFDKIFAFYIKSYDANPAYLTEPFEGVCDMLLKLNSMGIKCAVISNKPDFAAQSVCKEKFSDGLLEIVRGQIDGVKIKPDTEGVLRLMDELGVNAHEVVYIGDTDVDMHTGRNLGAYTVGVLWGFRDEEELIKNGADEIVSYPKEIVNIIERMNKKF